MKKALIILAAFLVAVVAFTFAGPEDPARFGNSTHATVYIGGSNGTGNFTGNVTVANLSTVAVYHRLNGTARTFSNGCTEVANSSGLYWTC